MSGDGSSSGAKREVDEEEGDGSAALIITIAAVVGGAIGYAAGNLWLIWQELKAQNQPYQSKSSNSTCQDAPVGNVSKDNNIQEGVNCILCLKNPKEIKLEPCNHILFCKNCVEKASNLCPVCRKEVKNKKVIK